MGGQQSKSKHRTPTFTPDSERDELTKSLSYQSNYEGTSVDTESACLQQEIPTTLSPLTEECTETEPIVMSGLPGEIGPTANFYLENTEETKTQTVLKHDEYLKEKKTSEESDCLKDSKLKSQNIKDNFDTSQRFSENLGKRDHKNLDAKQSFEEKSPIILDHMNNSEHADSDFCSHFDDVRAGRMSSVNSRLDITGVESNFDLKDDETANKNYHFPVHIDAKGIYKKKVTNDTEDNRCHCPLSDYDHSAVHKQIFTNVIFLPDKSKGASPKRYGPKRLGSIYDNSTEDAERIDQTAEKLPTTKVLSYKHDNEYFDSKKDQQTSVTDDSQAKRLDIDDRLNCDTDTANEKVQVNDQGVLTFVEDHFGFYTGSLAEGISKEFQGQIHSASKEIGTGLSESLTLSGKVETITNNSENILPENAISDNSGNSENQESREHVQVKPCNVETGQRRNINPPKTDQEMCNDTIKGEQKTVELMTEEDAVEICKKCKEPGDLCLCLFPDTKTVMHVKMKPPLSYLRYMSIHNKEINWSGLKSAQALFIKRLKSHKSEISEDNRVAFEFSLPSYKGFFGPDIRESERENCDEDMLEKNTGLVKAIGKKFELQLTGVPLTASIDSSRNIMINDFDWSSDDDDDDEEEEKTDDGTGDETDDESDIEDHEISYKTKCHFQGIKLTLSDMLSSGQNNSHSEERESCLRCTNQTFLTENKDPGNKFSETNIMIDKQEEQSYEEGKCCFHEGFTDKNSQAFSFRYSPESLLNKSLSSYEQSFTENGQCGDFGIKYISKSNEQLNSLGAEQLKCACVTRKDASGYFDVRNNSYQCDLKTEREEIKDVKGNGDEKNCNSSEIQKLDKGLKKSNIQKDVKKQVVFKRIKTFFEEDNRFKVDEVISDNFKQSQENNNHTSSTFRASCQANDEVSFQNQLTEEETDENNNVSVYSDSNVGQQSTYDCSSQGYNVVVGTDLELQNLNFETESELESGDFTSSSEDIEKSECSFEDFGNAFLCSFDTGKIKDENEFIGKTQEYDEENLSNDVMSNEEHKSSEISILQKEPGFINTENNTICDEIGEQRDDEKLKSERKVNSFQVKVYTTGEIKQSDRYLEPTSEFHKVCLDSEGIENHLNFVERKGVKECERTLSGKLFEHLKVACDIDGQQNDKQNKQFVKADIANRKGPKHVKGKMLYEDNPRNFHTAELRNMEGENVKVHLNSTLKRKQTKYEVDNRFAQFSSDDEKEDDCLKAEAAHVTDEKETPKSYRTEIKEDKNIPSLHPFQMGQSSGTLIRRLMEENDMDFSLPPQDLLKQLQEKNTELLEKLELKDSTLPSNELLKQLLERHVEITGVAKDLGLGNDFQVDFSLPPDKFRKQLQEKRALLFGSQEKTQHKGEGMGNHPRYDMRPQNAKSAFASSFYDNSPQKVDISQLGKATSSSEEKVKSGPTLRTSKTTDGEIRVVQEKLDAGLMAMLKSDSSDLSVSSSPSLSLVGSDDDDDDHDDSDDDDVPDVKVTDIWIPVIQQEKTKCHKSTNFEENLRCTVLCVDVSASMRGLPWQQIRTFVSDFLSGLEGKRHGDNIEEYVAMVTFGHETRIVAQPTKSYGQLADVLDSVNPGGNSPLMPGLALSMLFQIVRRESGRGCCRVSDVTLDHRIILLSDGHPSLSSDVGSSDELIDDLQHKAAIREVETSLREWRLPLHHAHVDCVPIGETPNIDFLETVCMATKGRLIGPSDVEVLVNSTRNHCVTAQVAKQMFKMTRGKVDQQMFKASVQSLLPNTTAADLAEMCTLLEIAHKRVRVRQRKGGLDTLGSRSASYLALDLNNSLKIGTRVCIGQDATEELSKKASGKGTITGHSRKYKGKVFVKWDTGVHSLCSCGYQGKFEVFPDESAVPCTSIKKGYKVKRGPDWQNGNQDGGADQLGTVRSVQADGFIRVSWSNGICSKYRYNHNGAFDVIIADESDPFGNKDFEVEMNKRNEEKSQT